MVVNLQPFVTERDIIKERGIAPKSPDPFPPLRVGSGSGIGIDRSISRARAPLVLARRMARGAALTGDCV